MGPNLDYFSPGESNHQFALNGWIQNQTAWDAAERVVKVARKLFCFISFNDLCFRNVSTLKYRLIVKGITLSRLVEGLCISVHTDYTKICIQSCCYFKAAFSATSVTHQLMYVGFSLPAVRFSFPWKMIH